MRGRDRLVEWRSKKRRRDYRYLIGNTATLSSRLLESGQPYSLVAISHTPGQFSFRLLSFRRCGDARHSPKRMSCIFQPIKGERTVLGKVKVPVPILFVHPAPVRLRMYWQNPLGRLCFLFNPFLGRRHGQNGTSTKTV